MPERVARVHLDEQAAAHELLERGDGLLLVAPAHLADEIRVERAANHRSGGEHLAGDLARPGDPRLDEAAHARRKRLVAVGVRPRVEVLHDEERHAVGLLVEPRGELRRSSGRLGQLGHRSAIQPLERNRGAQPLPRGGGEDPPHGMGGRRLFRAPGEHQQHPTVAQAAGEKREHLERRGVGPVGVVDHEHAGTLAGDSLQQRARHAVEKPRLRARPVERSGGRSAELRHQPGGLGRGCGRHRSLPAVAQRAAHEFDRAAVREAGLLLDAPHRRRRRASGTRPRDELLGEAGLPDPGLAFEDDEPSVRPGGRVGLQQLGPLALPADERQLRLRAVVAGSGSATGAGRATPSRTAWYAAVVSSVGATPSSRCRVRTHSRYCASAAARSPLAP